MQPSMRPWPWLDSSGLPRFKTAKVRASAGNVSPDWQAQKLGKLGNNRAGFAGLGAIQTA